MDDSDRQIVATINGRGVTRARLHRAFTRVQNREHWKNPVNAIVTVKHAHDVDVIREAIIFFTGSVPDVESLGGDRYRIRANGYYLTIGA